MGRERWRMRRGRNSLRRHGGRSGRIRLLVKRGGKTEDEARKKQLEETWRKEWEDKMISEEERTRQGRNSLRRRGGVGG